MPNCACRHEEYQTVGLLTKGSDGDRTEVEMSLVSRVLDFLVFKIPCECSMVGMLEAGGTTTRSEFQLSEFSTSDKDVQCFCQKTCCSVSARGGQGRYRTWLTTSRPKNITLHMSASYQPVYHHYPSA